MLHVIFEANKVHINAKTSQSSESRRWVGGDIKKRKDNILRTRRERVEG